MPAIPSLPTRELAEKAAETTTRVLDQVRTMTDVMSRHAAAFLPPAPGGAAAEAAKDLAGRFARTPGAIAQDAQAYMTDAAQRWVMFWDVMREAGNNFVEHERAGCPPVLVFDYETVVDGRELARPVNYALVRILPPEGVKIDDTKRPFIIVDPRAGHGPGRRSFRSNWPKCATCYRVWAAKAWLCQGLAAASAPVDPAKPSWKSIAARYATKSMISKKR